MNRTFLLEHGTLFIGIILVLMVWSLWKISRARKQLKRECGLIVEAGRNIWTAVPTGQARATRQMWLGALPDGHEESQFYQPCRIALLTGRIETDAIDYSSLIHWPRYWGGSFVFIGLLGTVLGIAFAVSGLGGSLQDSGSGSSLSGLSDLQSQIANLLANLRSAFYCTLAGLAGTLIVSAATSAYLRRSERLERELVSVLGRAVAIWGQAEREEESELAKNSRAEDTRRFEELRKDTLASWANLDKVIGAFQSAADRLNTTLIPTAEYFKKTASKTTELVASVERTTVAARSVTGALATEVTSLSSNVARLEETARSMEAKVANAGGTLGDAAAQLTKSATSLSDSASQLTAEREAITGVGIEVRRAATDMAKANHETRDAVREIAGHLQENQEGVFAGVADISEKHFSRILDRTELAITSLNDAVERSIEEHQAHLQGTTLDWQNTLTNSLQAMVSQLENQTTQWRNETSKTQESLRDLAEYMAKNFELVLTQLKNEGQAELQSHRTALGDYLTATRENAKELRTILRHFERTLADVAAVAEAPSLRSEVKQVRSAVLEAVESQRKASGVQEQRVSKILGEMQRLEKDLHNAVSDVQAAMEKKLKETVRTSRPTSPGGAPVADEASENH